ncbi:MAG TPA: zf-HC2 domain-containing protein [Bryobacteraceae bacterium]|nr:zf-HC2 domain-containing protein [Bryobacteraceae bacterium]
MSTRHPEELKLIEFADGELSGREAGKIQRHLDTCPECRTALEQIKRTFDACEPFRSEILPGHLHPAPARWADIYCRFEEIDATQEPAFFLRWLQYAGGAKAWAAAAVALVVIGALVYRLRETPAVQAAQLLQNAIVAADSRSVKPHRLHIRTKDHNVNRLVGATRNALMTTEDAATLHTVETMFAAARYDWQDPLNARSFKTWRDQLPEKKDEVVRTSATYLIRTSTNSDEMREASLELTAPDLRPVEGRFEFSNQDWVEITDLGDDTIPAESAAAAPARHTADDSAPERPASSAPSSSVPAPPATLGDELHAMAALHQVGADLGDPIEVARSGGKVTVTGIGISPERQKEIGEALATQANVVLRFSETPAASVQREKETPAQTTSNGDIRQLQAQIAAQVGGRANFEQLAADVLDLSEPMMARAFALRRLSEEFPAAAESDLSSQDDQVLRTMRQEHTAALKQQLLELERVLKPVRSAWAGSQSPAPGGHPAFANWQAATEDLFQSARAVQRVLAVTFGAAPGDAAGDQLRVRLLVNLDQLHAKLESYERANAQTGDRRDK